jgi:hypothetical protein
MQVIFRVYRDPQVLELKAAVGRGFLVEGFRGWEEKFGLLKIEKGAGGQIRDRQIRYQPNCRAGNRLNRHSHLTAGNLMAFRISVPLPHAPAPLKGMSGSRFLKPTRLVAACP